MLRILRKTISSAAKDPCHLERTFTAINRERGIMKEAVHFLVVMGHNWGVN